VDERIFGNLKKTLTGDPRLSGLGTSAIPAIEISITLSLPFRWV